MRTRSEYRLSPIVPPDDAGSRPAIPVADADRERLADVLLDAYRGTIDDEGEDHADAVAAIDRYLRVIHREHSFVLTDDELVVAMSFVLTVDETYYIDPVAVVSGRWQ